MLDIDGKISIPDEEFDLSFARGSGPGGQNVNKVNSKAVLYWSVAVSPSLPEPVRARFMSKFGHRVSADGVLVIHSDRFRDQRRNVTDCLEKVAAMVREVLTPPKPRRPTKPTKGAKERRLRTKREQSAKKESRRRQGGDW